MLGETAWFCIQLFNERQQQRVTPGGRGSTTQTAGYLDYPKGNELADHSKVILSMEKTELKQELSMEAVGHHGNTGDKIRMVLVTCLYLWEGNETYFTWPNVLNTDSWSSVSQLLEHGTFNARIVGLIPKSPICRMYVKSVSRFG